MRVSRHGYFRFGVYRRHRVGESRRPIHLYQGSGAGGEYITPSTPMDTALTENRATLNGYDMVMFPCQGMACIRRTSTR